MSGDSPLSMMRTGSSRIPRRTKASRRRRRRLWPIVVPITAVVVIATAWCGLWYLAASITDRTLSGWVQRETAAGRVYRCGSQSISGFPFRIETRCVHAAAVLKGNRPPFAVTARQVTFTAQVYHPTVLVGDITGPLTVAAPSGPLRFVATWTMAEARVSGVPPNPDSLAIRLRKPQLVQIEAGKPTMLVAAADAALESRIVGGSADHEPVIDTVLHFTSAAAPSVDPVLAAPFRGEIDIVVRGLKDLAPEPWPERFREISADGGDIEIKSLRLARTDAAIVGAGTLKVDDHGRLDGILRIAVAGMKTLVPQLGIDKLIGRSLDRLIGATNQSGLASLDRLVPGLSGVVRQGANVGIVDGLKKMGRPTEIDHKPATALPLRFSHGAVYLGMIRLGEVPPLF